MYGAENQYLYACKCIMKESPLPAVISGFFASVVVFGYMIRICERLNILNNCFKLVIDL